MGRPRRTIQKKPSGIFEVLLWIDGKRYRKSLETRDELVATKRASQAVRELKEQAAASQQTRWEADAEGIEWDIPTAADGSNDYANAVARKVVASEIFEPEQLKGVEWRDLLLEAIRVRNRKKGEPYSQGWHDGVERAIKLCPFTPLEANPSLINAWQTDMEKQGMSARYQEIHQSYLRSLIKISTKSGLLPHTTVNPFSLVDFSTDQVKHIETMLQADYEGLGQLLPTLPRPQRAAMLVQAFTGCRFSELKRRDAEDFDLVKGEFSIQHEPAKGKAVKNKHSIRVIPLPQVVVDELKGFDFKWCGDSVVNKRLKQVNGELSTHSFRHGLIRVNRDIGGDADAMEVFTGHRLAGMKSVYADGYGVDRLREVLTPCWRQVGEWLGL